MIDKPVREWTHEDVKALPCKHARRIAMEKWHEHNERLKLRGNNEYDFGLFLKCKGWLR